MKYPKVSIVFDRKKRFAKTGNGRLELVVELGRKTNKYITVAEATPKTWKAIAQSTEVMDKVHDCEKILDGMCILGEELTLENFNAHYGKSVVASEFRRKPKNEFNGFDQNMNFIDYMKQTLAAEDIAEGTRRHKQVVIDAVHEYGGLETLADITPANIMGFDSWLRQDGKRTDYTIHHNYHKKVHQYIRRLKMAGMIPNDPYPSLNFPKGKNKERRPLSEEELKILRKAKLTGKLDKARDLFVFCAYTGMAYCDSQAFDFKTMTEKVGEMYFIDGTRIKTSGAFFTPILSPAMEVLKKYNYKLPHISNQKANDYLHLIQYGLGINKNMTTHIARHSFATLALSHDIPMDNVSRMLGHKNMATTQIYAKILKKTVERNSKRLQDEID